MEKNKFRLALEKIYKRYTRREFVHPDPLEFLYNYPDARDREIAGLVASSLAYGNVKQIIKTVGAVLEKMGASPRAYVEKSAAGRIKRDFSGFRYRFTDGEQMAALLLAAGKAVRAHGTLGACALKGWKAGGMAPLSAQKALVRALYSAAPSSIGTLIPSPDKDSALKRINLFFRWQCRRDEVDPGGWQLPPRALVVPLDTHMNRIAHEFRLTARKDAGIKTALEITASFAELSPEDPIKYDFCLTRFGIRDELDLPDLRRSMASAQN